MNRIYKYEIMPDGTCAMPDAHQLLKVGVQNGGIFCWAVVDDAAPNVERRRFVVVPTSLALEDAPALVEHYVDTVFVPSFENVLLGVSATCLVFHVFKRNLS